MHFFDFIIRIYHDARSSECQTHCKFEWSIILAAYVHISVFKEGVS